MEARGRVRNRDITFKLSPVYLVSLGARSLLVRERGVNEVGGCWCCQDLGTGPAVPTAKPPAALWEVPVSPERLTRMERRSRAGSVPGDEWPSLIFGVSAGTSRTFVPGAPGGKGCWSITAPVPTNTLQDSACSPAADRCTGTPGMELAYWSFVCFLYFIGHFWETMYFLSADFVLVCTGNCREAYFFFMVIGSRCEPFAFTSESLSGVCTAVSVVCLK